METSTSALRAERCAPFRNPLRHVWLVTALLLLLELPGMAQSTTDPLPHWRDTPLKRQILQFVQAVSKKGSAQYVPEADRLAAFELDGVLWPEQPAAQLLFAVEELGNMAQKDSSLQQSAMYQALKSGNLAYFEDREHLRELFVRTQLDRDEQTYRQQASAFVRRAQHPRLQRYLTELPYVPMLELLQLLRQHGFKTYLVTASSASFVRTFCQQLFGIPPTQVIGTTMSYSLRERPSQPPLLWREPRLQRLNQPEEKAFSMLDQMGQPPILAVGRKGGGRDVSMLRLSQASTWPNLQLLLEHDDAVRELAYGQNDKESNREAARYGWHVVRLSQDWKQPFLRP